MVPEGGIEPPTRGFSVHCSTPELPGHGRSFSASGRGFLDGGRVSVQRRIAKISAWAGLFWKPCFHRFPQGPWCHQECCIRRSANGPDQHPRSALNRTADSGRNYLWYISDRSLRQHFRQRQTIAFSLQFKMPQWRPADQGGFCRISLER